MSEQGDDKSSNRATKGGRPLFLILNILLNVVVACNPVLTGQTSYRIPTFPNNVDKNVLQLSFKNNFKKICLFGKYCFIFVAWN